MDLIWSSTCIANIRPAVVRVDALRPVTVVSGLVELKRDSIKPKGLLKVKPSVSKSSSCVTKLKG